MNRDEHMRAAWRNWHWELPEDDVPATINPSFAKGFESAWRSRSSEIAEVLNLLDHLAQVWGDEGVFRTCRDRLRAMLTE